jgi:hypothetical protein
MKRTLPILLSFFSFTFAQAQTSPVRLPARFLAGERFYLKLAAASGDTLLGFCDTGGGFTATFPSVISRLGLTGQVKEMTMDGQKMGYIPFHALVKDARVPAPALAVFDKQKEPYFSVPDQKFMEGEGRFFTELVPQDAFLGQFFYAGKAWTFDYPKQQIWVHTPLPAGTAGALPLGFKKDKKGKQLFAHPRFTMEVAGEPIDVLFDTGATFILSEAGRTALGTQEKTTGGSFIAQSVFDRWHQQHPEWRIIEKADRTADMIEVPKVKLGSVEIGPVLFSKRPDTAWSKGMIHSMDKVVLGALGGSALKYVKVVADYNSEQILFSKD